MTIITANNKTERGFQMDTDTIIIMSLLATAVGWWLTLLIKEERQLIKQRNEDELLRLERAHKLSLITRRL